MPLYSRPKMSQKFFKFDQVQVDSEVFLSKDSALVLKRYVNILAKYQSKSNQSET